MTIANLISRLLTEVEERVREATKGSNFTNAPVITTEQREKRCASLFLSCKSGTVSSFCLWNGERRVYQFAAICNTGFNINPNDSIGGFVIRSTGG